LEQKKLELSILKQDTQLDLDVLRVEKESLEEEVGRLKGDAVSFTELDHTDIPVIEALESNEDLPEVLSEDQSPAENLEAPEESVEEESANESEYAPDVVAKPEGDLEPSVDHEFEFTEILDRDSDVDFERLSEDIREIGHDEPLEAGELSFHWTPSRATEPVEENPRLRKWIRSPWLPEDAVVSSLKTDLPSTAPPGVLTSKHGAQDQGQAPRFFRSSELSPRLLIGDQPSPRKPIRYCQ